MPVVELAVEVAVQPPVVVDPVDDVDVHWFDVVPELPVVVDVDGAVVLELVVVLDESVVGAVVVVVVVLDESVVAVDVVPVDEAEPVVVVELVAVGVEVVELVEVELVLLDVVEVLVLVPELSPDTAYDDTAPVDVVVSSGAQFTYTCHVDECSASQ